MTVEDPAVLPDTVNPPGQPWLRRGVGVHGRALGRMRDELGAPGRELALRGLARLGTEDPSVALLDAWAVVTDTVSFYNERIVNEGLLRTAVQLRSVRELSRTLGYELRPGVAAQVDLVFIAETAPGAPEVVTVAARTPVQSIPGPGELPQTFETGDELEVRGVWNTLAAVDARPQALGDHLEYLWVRGTTTVRPGDTILVVVGDEPDVDDREVRHVAAVEPDADGLTGWTRIWPDEAFLAAGTESVSVLAFRERLRLFGWNAPDPSLLVIDGVGPHGSERIGDLDPPTFYWKDFEVTNPLEVDGDRPELLPGSWVVLEREGDVQACPVQSVEPGGRTDYAISGAITKVTVEDLVPSTPEDPGRREMVVHAASVGLPTGEEPDTTAIEGRTVVVAASDPPVPAGRLLVLRGTDSSTGEVAVATAVAESVVAGGDGTMTLNLDRDVPAFSRQGLVVLANAVTATHGETVDQVLGSGDGRAAFATYRPRRTPLTYVRATTPGGSRAELTVRVDGVAWEEVEDLAGAGPDDRVYAVRHDEEGAVRVVLGDGVHGARPATGSENVTASYRVGIGEAGGVDAGAVSLLTRRPLGIREVTNPAAAKDWAPAEAIEEARANAPVPVRTLDRVVSVADHEDLARGYAGIGPARADLIWDGRANRVLLTVLGTSATEPSSSLLLDLAATIESVRDPVSPLVVLAGETIWFSVDVDVAHDPAYEREGVVAAVTTALLDAFSAPARAFAAPVTSAGVLSVVRNVPGVAACTVPKLYGGDAGPPRRGPAAVPIPPGPILPLQARDVLGAQPGHWDDEARPAELLALAADGVEIGVMSL